MYLNNIDSENLNIILKTKCLYKTTFKVSINLRKRIPDISIQVFLIINLNRDIMQSILNYNFIQIKGYFLNTKEYPYFCTTKIIYLKQFEVEIF